MAQIALTADFHWGVPGRLRDIHWAARVIRGYCQQKAIDTVLVLGDLGHDRAAMELDVWNTLYDFQTEAKALGQNWCVFPGNHDMFHKHAWTVNCIHPLQDHMTVLQDVCLLTLNGRRFFVLPFIHLEKSYMEVLRRIEQQYEEDDTLLTHIGVRGATLNTCFLLKDWSFVNFEDSKFRRIYTGHFHSRQSLNNQIYYPGSPIPFKFDEGDVPHGFYVLDLETMQHKFVNIWKWGAELFPDEPMPPQYYTVLDEQLEGVEPHIVQNNLIRIAHQQDYSTDERTQLRDRLMDMGARSVRWLTLKRDTPAPAALPVTTQTASTPARLFERWMEQDEGGMAGLDRNLMRTLNAEVQHEGDERYEYAEQE